MRGVRDRRRRVPVSLQSGRCAPRPLLPTGGPHPLAGPGRADTAGIHDGRPMEADRGEGTGAPREPEEAPLAGALRLAERG